MNVKISTGVQKNEEIRVRTLPVRPVCFIHAQPRCFFKVTLNPHGMGLLLSYCRIGVWLLSTPVRGLDSNKRYHPSHDDSHSLTRVVKQEAFTTICDVTKLGDTVTRVFNIYSRKRSDETWSQEAEDGGTLKSTRACSICTYKTCGQYQAPSLFNWYWLGAVALVVVAASAVLVVGYGNLYSKPCPSASSPRAATSTTYRLHCDVKTVEKFADDRAG